MASGGDQFRGIGFEFEVEALDVGVALLEGLELLAGLVAESDDLVDGIAVFTFEGMNEIETLFDFEEACGVEIDAIGVAGELGLEVVKEIGGLFVEGDEGEGGWVEAGKVADGAAEGAELGGKRRILVGEDGDCLVGCLEDFGCV